MEWVEAWSGVGHGVGGGMEWSEVRAWSGVGAWGSGREPGVGGGMECGWDIVE